MLIKMLRTIYMMVLCLTISDYCLHAKKPKATKTVQSSGEQAPQVQDFFANYTKVLQRSIDAVEKELNGDIYRGLDYIVREAKWYLAVRRSLIQSFDKFNLSTPGDSDSIQKLNHPEKLSPEAFQYYLHINALSKEISILDELLTSVPGDLKGAMKDQKRLLEVMLVQLKNEEGNIDTASKGKYVSPLSGYGNACIRYTQMIQSLKKAIMEARAKNQKLTDQDQRRIDAMIPFFDMMILGLTEDIQSSVDNSASSSNKGNASKSSDKTSDSDDDSNADDASSDDGDSDGDSAGDDSDADGS